VLGVELSRALRCQQPLSLVFLDLDHFKRINDDYGHEVGDQALQRIGRVVRHTFRASDSACRYGGEEFALVFPATSKEDGLAWPSACASSWSRSRPRPRCRAP
jgi:diguanylate cyclase (GGDEF)-like protein